MRVPHCYRNSGFIAITWTGSLNEYIEYILCEETEFLCEVKFKSSVHWDWEPSLTVFVTRSEKMKNGINMFG